MQITPIPQVPPVLRADDATVQRQVAAETQKARREQPPKAPFDPAPALRPTIQDKIEINRALLALRAL